MKKLRFPFLLTICLLMAVSLGAEEQMLINFAELTAGDDGQNPDTTIDFSNQVGNAFAEEDKANMTTSLALEQWEIAFPSSSSRVETEALSYVRESPVREDASRFAGETVMGVRVHFPTGNYNSWALVHPPFQIPAFYPIDDTDVEGSKFLNKGVLKNIGILKSISVSVLGRNFKHGLGLVLVDQNNREQTFFMDYLWFEGWKTITWVNANYINDVRNRNLQRVPFYPTSTPYYKLKGIIVYKNAADEGGDFITYIHDISIIYDKAVLDYQMEVDDELIWNIIEDREKERRDLQFRNLGEIQALRYLEQQRMAVETAGEDTDPTANPAAAPPAAEAEQQ